MSPPAKRAKLSSDSKCEIDYQLVLELVIERIGHVGILLALSRVNKRLRSAVFSRNGIRKISCQRVDYSNEKECNCYVNCTILNGIHIKSGTQIDDEHERKLIDGLNWIWKLAKKLRSIRILAFGNEELLKKVMYELSSLSVVQPRVVHSVKSGRDLPDSFLLPLVQENRRTLRKLGVFQNESTFETRAFWTIVSQCDQLETLHFFSPSVLLPEVINCPRFTHLRSLRVNAGIDPFAFCNAFSEETSRQSLQNLALFYDISRVLSELHRRKMSFTNATELRLLFLYCKKWDSSKWEIFFQVLPSLAKIRFVNYPKYLNNWNNRQWRTNLSADMMKFCQTLLLFLYDRSIPTEIEIETVVNQDQIHQQGESFMKAVKKADVKRHKISVEWCNDLIQKVILQKGNAKLNFTLKPKKQKRY